MIDKFAPIVPFGGLGGLTLGSTKQEAESVCERKLGAPTLLFDGKWSRYRIDDLLLLFFDEKSETLIKITALPAYRGKLFGVVGTDYPIKKLMELDHTFEYDEFEELCYSDQKGVVIDAPTIDSNAEWISVYVKDLAV